MYDVTLYKTNCPGCEVSVKSILIYWFSMPQELTQSYIEEAQRAADSAKEFRERTMFDMANKINEIKEKRRLRSEEERKKMDEEIR